MADQSRARIRKRPVISLVLVSDHHMVQGHCCEKNNEKTSLILQELCHRDSGRSMTQAQQEDSRQNLDLRGPHANDWAKQFVFLMKEGVSSKEADYVHRQ